MNILVIGGTRFIGKMLVYRLLAAEHKVTILSRGNYPDTFGDQVGRIQCDRADPVALNKVLQDKSFDVVYDSLCFNAADAKSICDIFNNINSVKYIFTSSSYVYPEDNRLFKESDFNQKAYCNKASSEKVIEYSEGKRQAESYICQYAEFSNIAVRFPIVLGWNDYTGRLVYYITSILKGKAIYTCSPEGKMNFIRSEDAADFLFWLLNIEYNGPINACSPECFTGSEMIHLIASTLNKEVNIVVTDGFRQDKIYYYSRMKNLILDCTLAEQLGYEFSSIYKWLANEINIIQSIEQ